MCHKKKPEPDIVLSSFVGDFNDSIMSQWFDKDPTGREHDFADFLWLHFGVGSFEERRMEETGTLGE